VVVVVGTAKKREEKLGTRKENDVASGYFRKKSNGDTPLVYSGRTALRREQCDS
jgi:penicillin-binding protein-related factor A (putative recombinase)